MHCGGEDMSRDDFGFCKVIYMYIEEWFWLSNKKNCNILNNVFVINNRY